MLNDAGFPDVSIVLSNNLDELVIWQIITQIQEEASRYGVEPDKLIKRLAYGVGTSLITSAGDAALDGVYKLVAICQNNEWVPTLKISENVDKTLNPGNKRVWRIYDQRGKATADLISLYDENIKNQSPLILQHPTMERKHRSLEHNEISKIEKLLVPVIKDGEILTGTPTIAEMREIRDQDIDALDPGVRRIMNPHIYHVSLSEQLWNLKQALIKKARSKESL
jgi:nicotinate phosphoribosyltransferase